MSKKQVVSFRFSDAMKKQLQALAAARGVSVAEFVRQLIAREMLK
jgi:predicted DNA-binding protein